MTQVAPDPHLRHSGVARDDSPLDVPPMLRRSWQRCRDLGLHPSAWAPPASSAARSSKALSALMPLLEDVFEFMEDSWSALMLADERACALELLGNGDTIGALEQLGLGQGSIWAEAGIGTNGVALALEEGHPVATVGADHFHTTLHPLAIAAAPLFGPEGELLGCVALVTRAQLYQAHALGLVAAAAQSAHRQLQMDQLLHEANVHLTEINAALEAMSEGLVLIGADGRIVRLNQRVEQIFGLSARAAAGRRLTDVLALPEVLHKALSERLTLGEQEVLFPTAHGTLAVMCALRPIYLPSGRYFGALLTLHSTERVRYLVQQMVGAQAQVSFRDIVGESQVVQLALRQARVAGNSSANVLLVGEHGTGKELLAHAIHQSSARAAGPFVVLDCATIPRTLIGIELFGSESTGEGRHGRPGKLELAHGGTLLLKAIDALPMEQQSALLRALESRASIRTGGRRVVPVNVRVIATSSSGLGVDEGRFRPDLAACLSGFVIEMPPLRVRSYDILLLVEHFMELLNRRLGKQLVLSPEASQALMHYSWPGNIRELESTLEQLVHATEQSVVQLGDLPAAVRMAGETDRPASGLLAKQYDHLEREAILRAARAVGGHLGRTAQQLGISRSTLWRKMREHGLSRADFQPQLT